MTTSLKLRHTKDETKPELMAYLLPMSRNLLNLILLPWLLGLLASPATGQFCPTPWHSATMTTGIWASEISWMLLTLEGETAAGPFGSYEDMTTYNHDLCLAPGCYQMLMLDSYGDGWQGASLSVFDDVGNLIDSFSMESVLAESVVNIGIEGACGCTDPDAAGFDPNASWDDGSCLLCAADEIAATLVLTTGAYADELEVLLVDFQDSLVASGTDWWGSAPWTDNTIYTHTGCFPNECLQAQLYDSYGDGWQGGSLEIQSWSSENGWSTLVTGTVPPGQSASGLTIPLVTDCEWPGCTGEEAFNFDPNATAEDGSCLRMKDNVSLYASWSNPELPTNGFDGSYSDVEGLAVEGREYAIVGSTMGTHIVDVTDTLSAQEVHFLAGAAAGSYITHRDYHIHGTLLYAVCDQGASTLQIWDLAPLPGMPTLLYDDDEFVSQAHNVFVDDATLTLYLASPSGFGWSSPLVALDVSNPAEPALLADLSQWIGGCHDLFALNDTVWINGNGGVRVLDMNPDPHLIGMLNDYPFQGGNHSGWWVPERDIYVFADETHGSPLKVVDCSDMSDLQVVGLLSSGTDEDAIPHNLMIREDLVFVSYYHDGLQVFDIQDPSNPVKVAWYDTFEPDHHIGYAGAWGVHSALPSGRVLISDVQSGLFVLNPTPITVDLCPGETWTSGNLTISEPGRWVGQETDPWFGESILWAEAVSGECPTCNGDFDNNANIGVSDLQFLLAQLGCDTSCSADMNVDGAVGVDDLLMLLMNFGSSCPLPD